MSSAPDDRHYTAEHEWVSGPGGDIGGYIGTVTVGITSSATQRLGDLVFVQLPDVGAVVTAGAVCGEVESTKSVSDLYSPVDGTVVAVNEAAVADPATVNADPYGEGWLFRVEATGSGPLLSAAEYDALES